MVVKYCHSSACNLGLLSHHSSCTVSKGQSNTEGNKWGSILTTATCVMICQCRCHLAMASFRLGKQLCSGAQVAIILNGSAAVTNEAFHDGSTRSLPAQSIVLSISLQTHAYDEYLSDFEIHQKEMESMPVLRRGGQHAKLRDIRAYSMYVVHVIVHLDARCKLHVPRLSSATAPLRLRPSSFCPSRYKITHLPSSTVHALLPATHRHQITSHRVQTYDCVHRPANAWQTHKHPHVKRSRPASVL